MDKYTTPEILAIPTAENLRNELKSQEGSEVRKQISALFDEGTFIETGAFVKRGFSDFFATEKSNEFEGVICGYGAVDGKLVFAFAEDASRMSGAIDERHAKKIKDIYALAIKNGAPIVGFFNSNGTDIFAGTAGLAAYGTIMSAVSEASGLIPQIAFVTGKCIGLSAAIAAMFDFTVKTNKSSLYVTSPTLTGVEDATSSIIAFSGEESLCFAFVKNLISFLPSNSDAGISVSVCADNLNRMIGEVNFAGDAYAVLSAVADNGVHFDVCSSFGASAVTSFATVGGVKCGLIVSSYIKNNGKLCVASIRKIAKFINFCDSFNIPVVTLVDSDGLVIDADNEKQFFAPEIARLATAYISASVPKITVIIGHAIGASYVLLGSKSFGADIVYAVDNSEVCALNADSGVAFAWDKYITLEKTRESLVEEWKATVSSPARAAASGEIDDIISVNELRARICSALLMLSEKGQSALFGRKVLPL